MSTSDNESLTSNAGLDVDNEIRQVLRALKYNDSKAIVLKPYLRAARWISPAIHPYATLTSVFFTGLEQESAEDDETSQGSEIDKAEELKIYQLIMKLHPAFEHVVSACAGHKGALQNFIHMLEKQSHSARNSDVSSINSVICEFILEDADRVAYDKKEFPLPAKTNLKDRGWNHPLFAILLYPMCQHDHLRVGYDELVEIITDIDNAVVDISESEWPAYLYPSDTSTDIEDDRKGLFRGNLLPIAFRNSFTSPQSALQPSSTAKGRLSKARLHHLTEVTGRTVAYICVLVRIALRGLGWTTDDGAFEYEVFYQNIVRMFEDDPDDPWVIDTLEWWNEQVPGLPKSTAAAALKAKVSAIANRAATSQPASPTATASSAEQPTQPTHWEGHTSDNTAPEETQPAPPVTKPRSKPPAFTPSESDLSEPPDSETESMKQGGKTTKRKRATAASASTAATTSAKVHDL